MPVMDISERKYNPADDDIRRTLEHAATDTALALGLIRVFTLLPYYDSSLDVIEAHLASSWEALLHARRLLDEPQ